MGSLDRSPESNWIQRVGGLDPYLEEVAAAVHKRGKTISESVEIAWGMIRKWATGGGDVNADTRAKAAKASANMEAKRARNRALALSSSHLDAATILDLAATDTEADLDAFVLDLAAELEALVVSSPSGSFVVHKDGTGSWPVIDLAPGDYRPPYDWKHGYIPLTPAAVAVKAGKGPHAGKGRAKPPAGRRVSKAARVAQRKARVAKAKDDEQRGRGVPGEAQAAQNAVNASAPRAGGKREAPKVSAAEASENRRNPGPRRLTAAEKRGHAEKHDAAMKATADMTLPELKARQDNLAAEGRLTPVSDRELLEHQAAVRKSIGWSPERIEQQKRADAERAAQEGSAGKPRKNLPGGGSYPTKADGSPDYGAMSAEQAATIRAKETGRGVGARVQTDRGPGTVTNVSSRGTTIDPDEGDPFNVMAGTPGHDRIKPAGKASAARPVGNPGVSPGARTEPPTPSKKAPSVSEAREADNKLRASGHRIGSEAFPGWAGDEPNVSADGRWEIKRMTSGGSSGRTNGWAVNARTANDKGYAHTAKSQKAAREWVQARYEGKPEGRVPGQPSPLEGKAPGAGVAEARDRGVSAGAATPGGITAATAKRMSDEQLERAMRRLMESGTYDGPAYGILEREINRRDKRAEGNRRGR